jgi:hypothetical protein
MNCDNFLGDKPSTRVRAPPGGRTSLDLFGGYEAAAPAPRAARAAPAAAPVAAPVAAPAAAPVAAGYGSYPAAGARGAWRRDRGSLSLSEPTSLAC